MPNAFQLQLSPCPTIRTDYTGGNFVGAAGASSGYFRREEDGYLYCYETHYASSHPLCKGKEKSQSGPPPHIHIYQAEYFKVMRGKMGVEIDGKKLVLTPESDEACVSMRARHRFYPLEEGGDMGVRVRADEYVGGFDESFIRNQFGYMADCDKVSDLPFTTTLARAFGCRSPAQIAPKIPRADNL